MAAAEQVLHIGGHDVAVTRPDKALFPAEGITKRDLIDYYRRVAAWILPHLKGRPLMLERYPDGVGAERIIQKAVARYYPSWTHQVTVRKAGGTVRHVVCDDEATLAYLVNQACVTPHIWLSRADRINAPDQMVFDLDPAGDDFASVVSTARDLREVLVELELPAFVKTTGSRGLHVVVPLRRDGDFDSVRAVARRIAETVVAADPPYRTLEVSRARRRGRLYVDVARNGYAQTMAAAYAVRARPGAPVSLPVDWRELDRPGLRPDGFTIRNVFRRLEHRHDPWKDFWTSAASFKGARRRVESRLRAA